MAAYYDGYDYPSYWDEREYEHESEVVVLKSILDRIPQINTFIDIGAGFGRLTNVYLYRAKKVILSDPSSSLLKKAKSKFTTKNIDYIHSGIQGLEKKVNNAVDVAMMVRVLHHIKDPDMAFKTVNKILKKDGYFILEFANKRHFKATLFEFLKGNLVFIADISPKDISSKKKKNSIPFVNYHPDYIINKLENNGFEVLNIFSVSNVRSKKLKSLLPKETLLFIEQKLQKPLGSFRFGPSIFVLAKKKGD